MKTNCTACEAHQDERVSMECPQHEVDHDSELKFHDEMEAADEENHMESMNERFLDNIGGC